MQIHVTLDPAKGERVGALFLNPGGSGFGAEDMVRGLRQFGPPDLTDNSDLVGVDPRGTGKSNPIACNDDEADAVRSLSDQPDDLDAHIADFSNLAAECERTCGTAIGSVHATLFPDSIRTMVLDAVVPTDPVDGTNESHAAGVEEALVKLDTSCELWLDCPLNAVGLLTAIEEGSIGDLDTRTFANAISPLF